MSLDSLGTLSHAMAYHDSSSIGYVYLLLAATACQAA